MADATLLALVAVWFLLTIGLPLLYCARQRDARAHCIGLAVGLPAGMLLHLLICMACGGWRLIGGQDWDGDWDPSLLLGLEALTAIGGTFGAYLGPVLVTRRVGSQPQRTGTLPGLVIVGLAGAGLLYTALVAGPPGEMEILLDALAVVLMLALAALAAMLALLGAAIGGLWEKPASPQNAPNIE